MNYAEVRERPALAVTRKHLPQEDRAAFDAGTVEDDDGVIVVRNNGTTWRALPSGLVLRIEDRGGRFYAAYLRNGIDVANPGRRPPA